MNEIRAFFPLYTPSQSQPTVQIGQCSASVTVVASNGVAVASAVFPGTLDNTYVQVQISNKTSVWVHVNFGVLSGGQTVRAAALSDYPVPPGTAVVVSVDPEVNAASVFADGAPAGSTSVIFTRGAGQ